MMITHISTIEKIKILNDAVGFLFYLIDT